MYICVCVFLLVLRVKDNLLKLFLRWILLLAAMFFDVLCSLVKPVVNSQLGWSFGHSLRFTAYKEYELTIKSS